MDSLYRAFLWVVLSTVDNAKGVGYGTSFKTLGEMVFGYGGLRKER